MILAPSIAEIRAHVAAARRSGATIGVVPTMGALHAGHGALIDCARQECGYVVVTIFVNPIQFNRKEDLDRYPRTLETDTAFCEQLGADAIFAPSVDEMYPGELLTSVDVAKVTEKLEGEFRPGHFRGVSTVVAKLFNIIQADRAYFGEKDAQQLALIRKMATDLNFACTIVPVATVREADGLAMSSRNRLLTPEERALAPAFHRALLAAQQSLTASQSIAHAKEAAARVIAEVPVMRLEYLEVADAQTMQPIDRIVTPARIAGAVWLGKVRLIDNVPVLSR